VSIVVNLDPKIKIRNLSYLCIIELLDLSLNNFLSLYTAEQQQISIFNYWQLT
jgi:hypothetical protein